MTQLAQGVFITDQLYIPRYMWYKMKCSLPNMKDKVIFFEELKSIFEDVRILYNKGAVKMKHLQTLTKTLMDMREKIGL